MNKEKRKMAVALAASIQLAEKRTSPRSEAYWQTREACVAEARRRGIPTTQLLFTLQDLHPADHSTETYEMLSASVWELVCPPVLKIAEVLGS